MKIAERIGCSPSEAKWKTPVTEFIRWQLKFHREFNEPSRDNWYHAQFTYEIARLTWFVEHIAAVLSKVPQFEKTVKDYLLEFKDEKDLPKNSELPPDEKDKILMAKVRRSQMALRAKLNAGRNVPEHARKLIEKKKGKK